MLESMHACVSARACVRMCVCVCLCAYTYSYKHTVVMVQTAPSISNRKIQIHVAIVVVISSRHSSSDLLCCAKLTLQLDSSVAVRHWNDDREDTVRTNRLVLPMCVLDADLVTNVGERKI